MGPQGPVDIPGAVARPCLTARLTFTVPCLGWAEDEGCRIQAFEGYLWPMWAEVPELKPLVPEAGSLCLY